MSILEPAAVAASITPDELRARLDDPTVTVVDVRPIAAYNGWRLNGEARGGHVPGAKAFPAAWLGTVDQPEIARLLAEKGATQGRDIVVYGDGDTDAHALAAYLRAQGIHDVATLDGGFAAWAADTLNPVDRLAGEQRAERVVELGRRSAVPVLRRLEPVRVQEMGARDVSVRVLLGHAEVDVE